PNEHGRTPASTRISFLLDTDLDLAFAGATVGLVLFVVWANFLITAWSNAVNLTDGLDGLATGVSLIVFGSYVLVGIWQLNQTCQRLASAGPSCYETRDPQDLAIVAAAIVGACFGFLWWNASPAKIFMGDTGSLALGGALAGLSILTRTEFLALIIGGLFVIIVLSDVIQIGFFKMTGRRVFKMAPLHHHFELSGRGEVTIGIRFSIIAGLFVARGVGGFYAEWVAGYWSTRSSRAGGSSSRASGSRAGPLRHCSRPAVPRSRRSTTAPPRPTSGSQVPMSPSFSHARTSSSPRPAGPPITRCSRRPGARGC